MSSPKKLLQRPKIDTLPKTKPVITDNVPAIVLLTPTEIKGKISPLYFREESKSYYQQKMLEASMRKLKSGKHTGSMYCDVLKSDPKYIMFLLKCDYVKPDELRDYLILSIPAIYVK